MDKSSTNSETTSSRGREVPFEKISPLPSTSTAVAGRKYGGRKQHSEIITATPNRKRLEGKDMKRKQKQEKETKGKNKSSKQKKCRRKLLQDDSETSSDEDVTAVSLCDDDSDDDSVRFGWRFK